MKSVRTPLSKHDTPMFRIFLDSVGLTEVMIGDYEDIESTWYLRVCICYAYSDKSAETVAILTHITLKYGSLYKAFSKYMIDKQSSSIDDPTFNWIP